MTTIQPRADRPLVHAVRALGGPTQYGRMAASTLCGKQLSGWPGEKPVTCKACLAAIPSQRTSNGLTVPVGYYGTSRTGTLVGLRRK